MTDPKMTTPTKMELAERVERRAQAETIALARWKDARPTGGPFWGELPKDMRELAVWSAWIALNESAALIEQLQARLAEAEGIITKLPTETGDDAQDKSVVPVGMSIATLRAAASWLAGR